MSIVITEEQIENVRYIISLDENIPSSHDYLSESLSFSLSNIRYDGEDYLQKLITESSSILNSVNDMLVVVEAVEDNTSNQNNKASFFSRIRQLLKTIFNTFINKIKELADMNGAWLKENEKLLGEINYDGLKVTMVPYWNMDIETSINQVRSRISTLVNPDSIQRIANDQNNNDKETLLKKHFSEFLDDGNLANGAKNYFRVGKASASDIKPVELAGNALRNNVTTKFIPYCKDYGTNVKTRIQSFIDISDRWLGILEKGMVVTTESQILIENSFSTVVLEAENPPPQNQTQTADDKQPASATSVTVTDTKAKDDGTSAVKKSDLSIQRNFAQAIQTLSAALLTAAEERYTSYMKAMKEIAKARKNTAQKQPEATG